jgi:hypothetical protein
VIFLFFKEKTKKKGFTCGGRAACGNEKEKKTSFTCGGVPKAVKK